MSDLGELERKIALVEACVRVNGKVAGQAMWRALGLPAETVEFEGPEASPFKANSLERLCQRILKALREAPDGEVSMAGLQPKTQGFTGDDRHRALEVLLDRGLVVWREKQTRTKSAIMWRLAQPGEAGRVK